MDEDTEEVVIETIHVVSTVCFHEGNTTEKTEYHTNLR
jgi:hypothetical protein